MKCCCTKVQFTKFILIVMNFLYLICGLLLVAGGLLLLDNTNYLLLSRIIQPTSIQPIFYYVALSLMGVGLVIVSISILGCWATQLDNYCFLAFYLFALLVLLLAEGVVGILVLIFPENIGVNLNRDALTSLWQRSYGIPGKDQFTASIDLVQTKFECCGISSSNEWQASWWRLRELGPPYLLVPLTCCVSNATNVESTFLDPEPVDMTQCQKHRLEDHREARNMRGCFEPLTAWIVERVSSLMLAGIGKLTIQLLLLLVIILIYTERHHGATGKCNSTNSSNSKRRVVGVVVDGGASTACTCNCSHSRHSSSHPASSAHSSPNDRDITYAEKPEASSLKDTRDSHLPIVYFGSHREINGGPSIIENRDPHSCSTLKFVESNFGSHREINGGNQSLINENRDPHSCSTLKFVGSNRGTQNGGGQPEISMDIPPQNARDSYYLPQKFGSHRELQNEAYCSDGVGDKSSMAPPKYNRDRMYLPQSFGSHRELNRASFGAGLGPGPPPRIAGSHSSHDVSNDVVYGNSGTILRNASRALFCSPLSFGSHRELNGGSSARASFGTRRSRRTRDAGNAGTPLVTYLCDTLPSALI